MASEYSARLLYEKAPNRVAIVTLNRPEALNACTQAMWRQLAETWDEIKRDDGVSVVVLTGAGDRAFCAGVDLVEMAGGSAGQDRAQATSPFGPPPRLLENWDMDFWKPIVCAINGLALGSGFSMILATDVRIASENASFGLSQIKWGLLSGHATQLAPRFLSFPQAMELLLTGESITAARAYELGLVNRVVPQERLMEEAVATRRSRSSSGRFTNTTVSYRIHTRRIRSFLRRATSVAATRPNAPSLPLQDRDVG